MKVPRTSPNNDESTPNNAEQEGTLGKVLVVMVWGLWACVRGHGGCGDIPFLADGNYGVMVESPGSCDGISLNS